MAGIVASFELPKAEVDDLEVYLPLIRLGDDRVLSEAHEALEFLGDSAGQALVRATRLCTREPGREGGISVSLRRDATGAS